MRRIFALFLAAILSILCCCPVYAASVPKEETPKYKVAFYAMPNYHIQSPDGKRSGYGYDMMQHISKHLQYTFSYVGYENTPQECEEMLRDGRVDIFTAAKHTPEREEFFAFSRHPAITATTYMNVKRGNTKIVAGDYSTYNGIRVGLLEGHTYNDQVLRFARENGIEWEVRYYSTAGELSKALIYEEVDALVDSYIRIPEDEETIENFGQTPYYFMVRKEDQQIVQQIDAAIDVMNMTTPQWRTELYHQYYGARSTITELTAQEEAFLRQLQNDQVVVRAVMGPDKKPYSWYENGEGYGIAADFFIATAQALGLGYEIVPVSTKGEWEALIAAGAVDVWLDIIGDNEGNGDFTYRVTQPYLSTTLSILRPSGSSGKINQVGIVRDNLEFKDIIRENWPEAQIIMLEGTRECKEALLSGRVDAVLMRSYRAQQLAGDDTRNRFRAEIVPSSTLDLRMGINSEDSHLFFSLWEKVLMEVSETRGAEITQKYLQEASQLPLVAYLYDHPAYLGTIVGIILIVVSIVSLWLQAARQRKKQQQITDRLSDALAEVQQSKALLEEQYRLVEAMSREMRDGFVADILHMTSTTIKVNGVVLPKEQRMVRPYESTWDHYIEKYVHPDDRTQLREAVRIPNVLRDLEGKSEAYYRYRLTAGGKITHCQLSFSHIGGSTSPYLMFATRDIDEIIRVEREQQKALEEARDMAEAANKAKSAFLFSMSHDIRTPMNAISGYTDLILKHSDDMDKCIDYAHKIRWSSDFLLSLVNNVLEMARIESNRMTLNEAPVAAEQITQEVYAVYSELMKQKQITFVMTSQLQPGCLYADKVRLKEIFLNLISNAYKYTPEGGTVTLAVRELPDPREGYVLLEILVSDTGIGMSQDFLPQLFEEFSRERSAADSGIQGTGLGMPIVKRIVDLMGGTITVKSAPGEGTTFVVRIPHRKARMEDGQKEDEVPVDTQRFVGKRLLIAEDNELNAEIITEILQEMGFLVERAADGLICVQMLLNAPAGHYDAILMDIQMPNLDGFKATRAIRAMEDPGKCQIPIIAMTANAFEEDRRNSLAAGMNDHIAKPIEIRKLQVALAAVIH